MLRLGSPGEDQLDLLTGKVTGSIIIHSDSLIRKKRHGFRRRPQGNLLHALLTSAGNSIWTLSSCKHLLPIIPSQIRRQIG
jgi:hypothetical protein